MPFTVRPAREDDAEALADLSHEAFGYPRQEARSPLAEGRSTIVATDGVRVVGSATCHRYGSWWWGQTLPTAGIAGVKVAPEARGSGLVRRLIEPLLEEARGWGAVVSTLFATAPAIYRPLGYEVVATYDDETVVPTAVFRDLAPGPDALRRAVPDDLPAIVDAYEAWARQHNGPLTRRGPLFPADRAFTGGAYTLAEREGRVTGVLRWDRTSRYGEPESTLEVHDLIALDAGAAASLLASLGSHSAVAPRAVVSTSGLDVLHLLVPPRWTRRTRPRPCASPRAGLRRCGAGASHWQRRVWWAWPRATTTCGRSSAPGRYTSATTSEAKGGARLAPSRVLHDVVARRSVWPTRRPAS
ncbi:enhanced intracellular survival protein Eis [Kytococcus sedentarius]|uniref:GNAT family N-acetyltransferase n=1 Tax=Kytococcus sedentarius TaxID=1276 RepID=UPI00384DDAE9